MEKKNKTSSFLHCKSLVLQLKAGALYCPAVYTHCLLSLKLEPYSHGNRDLLNMWKAWNKPDWGWCKTEGGWRLWCLHAHIHGHGCTPECQAREMKDMLEYEIFNTTGIWNIRFSPTACNATTVNGKILCMFKRFSLK